MNIEFINALTRTAYEKTADKYFELFHDEMQQKEYDRLIMDRFAGMLKPHSAICDAGCGPCGNTAAYLAGKGHTVTGIDLSERCIELATANNPGMDFRVMDMMHTGFEPETFDGIVSFYSILYTPKEYIHRMFKEFYRTLKPDGKLLVVVKKGISEGIIDNEWYEGNKVYFTYFDETEIMNYFAENHFSLDLLETRKPYDFEINVDRIYAIGTKMHNI